MIRQNNDYCSQIGQRLFVINLVDWVENRVDYKFFDLIQNCLDLADYLF